MELKRCPFCDQIPQRIGSRAVCDGIVDGKDIHSTISLTPREWNTRASSQARIDALQRALDGLLEATVGLIAFAEDAETKALVGDEGCLWPVEAARVAIAEARGAS